MADPRQIGPNAPTGMLQYDVGGWVGRGCDNCLAWQAQIHVDDDGHIWAIERHANGCSTHQEDLPLHAAADD